MTLTEFLWERIAEDERIARGTGPHSSRRMGLPCDKWDQWFSILGPYVIGNLRHIVHNSPERIVVECEAKRRIIDDCMRVLAIDGWEYDDAPNLASAMLVALAAPYAAHPDYDQTWRPRAA